MSGDISHGTGDNHGPRNVNYLQCDISGEVVEYILHGWSVYTNWTVCLLSDSFTAKRELFF